MSILTFANSLSVSAVTETLVNASVNCASYSLFVSFHVALIPPTVTFFRFVFLDCFIIFNVYVVSFCPFSDCTVISTVVVSSDVLTVMLLLVSVFSVPVELLDVSLVVLLLLAFVSVNVIVFVALFSLYSPFAIFTFAFEYSVIALTSTSVNVFGIFTSYILFPLLIAFFIKSLFCTFISFIEVSDSALLIINV